MKESEFFIDNLLVRVMAASDLELGGGLERDFFIDNLLLRIHLIIVMIGWTGLAPWDFGSEGDLRPAPSIPKAYLAHKKHPPP